MQNLDTSGAKIIRPPSRIKETESEEKCKDNTKPGAQSDEVLCELKPK